MPRYSTALGDAGGAVIRNFGNPARPVRGDMGRNLGDIGICGKGGLVVVVPEEVGPWLEMDLNDEFRTTRRRFASELPEDATSDAKLLPDRALFNMLEFVVSP